MATTIRLAVVILVARGSVGWCGLVFVARDFFVRTVPSICCVGIVAKKTKND